MPYDKTKNKILQIALPNVIWDRLSWLMKEDAMTAAVAIRIAISDKYAQRTGEGGPVSRVGRPRTAGRETQEMKIENMKAMPDAELTQYLYDIGYNQIENIEGGGIKRYWIETDAAGQRAMWQGYFKTLEDKESYYRGLVWNLGELIADLKKEKKI